MMTDTTIENLGSIISSWCDYQISLLLSSAQILEPVLIPGAVPRYPLYCMVFPLDLDAVFQGGEI
jgi:hypothetical protein